MREYFLKYSIGQLIEHKKLTYRGVVYDADAQFSGSDEWCQVVALSRTPKDAPWYHVLVEGGNATTYVAERKLQASHNFTPIRHSLINVYFSDFKKERYILARQQ